MNATPTSSLRFGRGLAVALLIPALVLGRPLTAAPVQGPAQTQPQAAPVPAPEIPAGRPPTEAEVGAVKSLLADLDRDPDAIVAEIDGRPVTRADVAVAIRAMPPGLDARPSKAVFQDGAAIAMQQKVLAARAAANGLDKLPSVIHRMADAVDDALADVYLRGALNANMTDEVLHRAYDQWVAGKPGPDEVKARTIVTDSAEAADSAMSRIAAGASFDNVARTESKDPTSERGGDLGYLQASTLAPDIAAILFSLDVGQTTAYPVHSGDHWFILQVMGRRVGPVPSFEDVRPVLAHDLAPVEIDRIKKWARADAKIVYQAGFSQEAESQPPIPSGTPEALEASLARLDKSPETSVADVNGKPATFADVAEAIRAIPRIPPQATFQQVFRQAAELVIDRKVLADKAIAAGLVTNPAIHRRIEAAREKVLGQELLQRSLKPALLEPAMKSTYDARPVSRDKVQEVQLRVIAAESRAQAEEMIRQIKGGADFADVARGSSRDPSAANGGLLGYVRQETLTPELGAVGFALPVNGMTAYPVRSGGLWWVVRCEGRHERPPLTFTEARPDVERYIVKSGSADLEVQAIKQTNVNYYGLIGKSAPADAPK
jgi:peptidyl-prolyl cis-trans isomerase C